jgi:hypothetical protein
MEHLLLCVALLTGIALVCLDLISMQFPTVEFHRSRLALELFFRLGVCFRVITEICDRLSANSGLTSGDSLGVAFIWDRNLLPLLSSVFSFFIFRPQQTRLS